MSNESKKFFDKRDQEEKLVKFYDDLISGNANPSTEYQKQFLLQLLNTKISQLEPKTNKKKNLHFFLRIVIMILSGTSTILLGYKFDNTTGLSTNLNNITLIITAAVTLLSSLAVFWDIENYWVRNKIMLNKLKELRYEYVFFLTGNSNIETKDLKEYLDKFLTNLGDEYWEKFLKDVRKNNAEPKPG
jgi:Protein of unknown function (DUF4231)